MTFSEKKADPRAEREHLLTRLTIFREEYRRSHNKHRLKELQIEMLETAREIRELTLRNAAERMAYMLLNPVNQDSEARYVFDVAVPNKERGIELDTFSDGPRNDSGKVMTYAELREEGDPVRVCVRRLALQARNLQGMRSERRRNLIEAHGRRVTDEIIKEIEKYLDELAKIMQK